MIIIIRNYGEFMRKLSESLILKDESNELNLVLDTNKRVQSQTARYTIRIDGLIKEYPDHTFNCHTVSNFVKVVSNDIKDKYSTIYVYFCEKINI